MASCENCVSGCQSCNNCDRSCQICQSGCNSCQGYCETHSSQVYSDNTSEGSFSWSVTPIANETHMGPSGNNVFTQAVWDEIIAYVNNIRTLEGKSTYSTSSKTAVSPSIHITLLTFGNKLGNSSL